MHTNSGREDLSCTKRVYESSTCTIATAPLRVGNRNCCAASQLLKHSQVIDQVSCEDCPKIDRLLDDTRAIFTV